MKYLNSSCWAFQFKSNITKFLFNSTVLHMHLLSFIVRLLVISTQALKGLECPTNTHLLYFPPNIDSISTVTLTLPPQYDHWKWFKWLFMCSPIPPAPIICALQLQITQHCILYRTIYLIFTTSLCADVSLVILIGSSSSRRFSRKGSWEQYSLSSCMSIRVCLCFCTSKSIFLYIKSLVHIFFPRVP